MKALLLAALLFPVNALGCDLYKDHFMTGNRLTETDVVYETVTGSDEPAFVIRMKDGDFALAVQDTPTCTFDVVKGDLNRVLYYMEEHVYN